MRLRPPPSVCRRVFIVGEATRYSPLQLNDLPKSAFAAALAAAVSTPAATVTAVADKAQWMRRVVQRRVRVYSLPRRRLPRLWFLSAASATAAAAVSAATAARLPSTATTAFAATFANALATTAVSRSTATAAKAISTAAAASEAAAVAAAVASANSIGAPARGRIEGRPSHWRKEQLARAARPPLSRLCGRHRSLRASGLLRRAQAACHIGSSYAQVRCGGRC